MKRIGMVVALIVLASGCGKATSGPCAAWEACCKALAKQPKAANVAKACPEESGKGSWAVYRALPLGSDGVCKDALTSMQQGAASLPGGAPAECR